ncbi:MAG: 3-isopropylmalate dehydratase large subunit, partial [Candidatus Tectomicrobia bacterium]|nr:3-isopropylmalate dehydratase large subunit [Candidatus Tectomicrobia bacterium]
MESHIVPGMVLFGADSHTCTYGAVGAFATGVGSTDLAAAWALGELWFRVPETIRVNFWGKLPRWVTGKDLILKLIGEIGVEGALYKALEFGGDTMPQVNMAGRFTMCNMAIEAGAKTGIVEPDEVTGRYVERRAPRPFTLWHSDRDSVYCRTLDFFVDGMEPLVARPFSPGNVVPLGSLGRVEIDQVVIGSCTNGRLEDLRLACEAMQGKRVHSRVRAIVVPGSQRVLALAISEGLISRLVAAGAVISPPTCGPCLGGHMGVLADGERCLSTTNRNFVGRMGDPSSEVYLSGPAVAGASAVLGRIAHPEEV